MKTDTQWTKNLHSPIFMEEITLITNKQWPMFLFELLSLFIQICSITPLLICTTSIYLGFLKVQVDIIYLEIVFHVLNYNTLHWQKVTGYLDVSPLLVWALRDVLNNRGIIFPVCLQSLSLRFLIALLSSWESFLSFEQRNL